MLPAIVDLKVTQGDSFAQTFHILENAVPVDLTGSVIEAEFTDRSGAKTPFTVTVEPAAGAFTLSYSGPPPHYGPYRYDVEETDADSYVRTWIKGRFDVARDITNAIA